MIIWNEESSEKVIEVKVDENRMEQLRDFKLFSYIEEDYHYLVGIGDSDDRSIIILSFK